MGMPLEAIRISSTSKGEVVVEVFTSEEWAKGAQWIEVFRQAARDFCPDEGTVSHIIEAPGVVRRYQEQAKGKSQ